MSQPITSNTLNLLNQPTRLRLSEQIAKQIKGLIQTEKLKVGQKLPTERELTESLNVSRVVVREALRSLEQAGFIEIRPGHAGGSFVSNKVYKPLFEAINDLFQDGGLSLQHFADARTSIETTSLKLAIEHTVEADISQLIDINKKILSDVKNNEKFHIHNMEFHVKISEISQNPLIKLLVGALLNILIIVHPRPVQSADFIKTTYLRHSEIIHAMREKDAVLGEKLIQEDVDLTKILVPISK